MCGTKLNLKKVTGAPTYKETGPNSLLALAHGNGEQADRELSVSLKGMKRLYKK